MIRPRSFVRTALVALVTTGLLVPAAGAATLKGQVIGASYPDGARTAVPVLLQAAVAKKAKLATPFALLSLTKVSKATATGGAVSLDRLRIGDAFTVKGTVTKAARKSAYPKLKASGLRLTKRGSTRSAAELSDQIDQLTTYVQALGTYTVGQVTDLRSQLAGLRADLSTLSALVKAIQASIPGLPADPANTLTTLITQVSTLQSQLTSLTGQLTTATSDISALAAKLAGINPGDLTAALANIGQLQALVGGINVPGLNTQLATLLGNIGGTNAGTLTGQIGSLQTALGTAQSQLTFLCTTAGLVKGTILGGLLTGGFEPDRLPVGGTSIGPFAGLRLAAPARDRDLAGAHHLDQPERAHQRSKRLDLVVGAGDLDHDRAPADVDDLAAEDLGDLHHLTALEPSAETLNSASSRATASSGSRSRIFSTLMSLWSCLVTWSIGCLAPSTVSVMRDTAGSSVGPTASVSMLKPRRANSPRSGSGRPACSRRGSRACACAPCAGPPAASRSSSDSSS